MGVLSHTDSKQELGFGSCVVSQKITPTSRIMVYSFTYLFSQPFCLSY